MYRQFSILAILIFSQLISIAQGHRLPTPSPLAGTADGELHDMVVFDREGNHYFFSDLKFDLSKKKKTRAINPTYTAGIFRLHFDDAGTNTGFDDAALGLQRVNVAVQVFTDLSNLINEANSPYTSIANLGSANSYLEIHVQPSLNNIGNSTLGNAGQFFLTTSPGIVHGSVWQTINSGLDAWFGVGPTNLGTVGTYHGLMQINFGHNFYLGTNAAAIGATQVDLYSVILHEAMHALGIGSLIAQNGNSKLTNSNPGIYSAFDTYITDVNNTKIINWNNCFQSSFVSANLSKLTTPCALKFNGTQPLFISSDAAWSNGTSLSHFPAACGNTGNFVMNPGMTAGTTKRFPDAKEVSALCNLGYSLSGIYPGSSYTPCGSRIAGTNDYATYTAAAPGANYSGPANTNFILNSTDFLGNDENATYYSCLEVVNQSGTLSGNLNGGIGTSITFTPTTNFAGTAILKYIPKENSNGKAGNITYIFIDITPPPLAPCVSNNACEMLCYGGFEEFTSQAQYDIYTSGGYTSNNNVSFAYYPATYPDNSPDLRQSGFYTGAGIINCNGPNNQIFSHGGTQLIGMILRNTPATSMNNPEGPALPLNGTVLPGESVTVSVWLRLADQSCMGGVEARLVSMAPCLGNQGILLANCVGLQQTAIIPSGVLAFNNSWQQKTMTITNTTAVPMTHLLINSLPYTPYIAQPFGFIYMDDVSCIKNVPKLQITKTGPATACTGDTLTYTISVTNNSLSPANNVQLKDSLGLGLTAVSGGSFTYPVTTIASIAAGATQTFTLKASTNASFGTITNTAYASSGACADSGSVTQCNTTIVNQTLSIQSTTSPIDPCRGDTILLTMDVCNYSSNAINPISLQTPLPLGYSALPGAGYTIAGGNINWANFNLAAGTSTTPSCTTLTAQVIIGTQSNSLCTQIITGGNKCSNKTTNCTNINVINCWPESLDELSQIKNLLCYPNPTSEKLFFEFESNHAGSLDLLNAIGQVISTTSFEKGIQKININTSQLANGHYQYRIVINGHLQKTDKVIILHN
jgi:uncharacterized repeat protein (TIGR01451 family)